MTHASKGPKAAADEPDVGPAVSRGSGLSPEQRRYLEARARAKGRTVFPVIVTLAACGLIIGRPQPTTLRIAVGVAVLAAGVVLSGLLYLRWRRRSDATDAQVSAWQEWTVSGRQGPLDDEDDLPDAKR